MRLLLPEPAEEPDLLELYGRSPDRYLRAGFVTSLDGAIAVGGRSAPLSGEPDRAVFRALRAVCDVVLVGAGTARAENYGTVRIAPPAARWRAEHGRSPVPPLAVVSRRLELDPGSRLFDPDVRPLIITCAESPADRRRALSGVAEVLIVGEDEVDLPEALEQLAERDFSRVLCEGGPELLLSAVRVGVLDELCITLSPSLVGADPRRALELGQGSAPGSGPGSGPGLLPGPLVTPARLHLVHLLAGDDALMARYRVD